MQSNIYVSLSTQLALQRRMETIANNVANATTAGFRAEEMTFEQIDSQTQRQAEPVSYVSRGLTRLSLAPGELTQTSNPLDVAIRGRPHENAYAHGVRLSGRAVQRGVQGRHGEGEHRARRRDFVSGGRGGHRERERRRQREGARPRALP